MTSRSCGWVMFQTIICRNSFQKGEGLRWWVAQEIGDKMYQGWWVTCFFFFGNNSNKRGWFGRSRSIILMVLQWVLCIVNGSSLAKRKYLQYGKGSRFDRLHTFPYNWCESWSVSRERPGMWKLSQLPCSITMPKCHVYLLKAFDANLTAFCRSPKTIPDWLWSRPNPFHVLSALCHSNSEQQTSC